ncbi:MAG TPA: HEAT repeat domain-containing protein [Planctomycetota bacterium]|nr:HEAT repeat domain-containing protein [Planctomycetota bacterium]
MQLRSNTTILALLALAPLAPLAQGQLVLPDRPRSEPTAEQTPRPQRRSRTPDLPKLPRGNLAETITGLSPGGTEKPESGIDLPAGLARSAPIPSAPAPSPPDAVDPAVTAPTSAPGGSSPAAEFVVAELRRVRDPASRLVAQGAQSLLAMGEPGLAAARGALAEPAAPMILLGARVLLMSGSDDAELVLRRVRGRLPTAACAALVDTIAHVDPVRGSPKLMAELLAHPQAAVRAAAFRNLDSQRSAELVESLRLPLVSELTDARLRAVQLLAGLRDPAAVDLLLEHLADRSAQVAARATSALADSDDERVVPALLERAFSLQWVLREGAFALLALIEREDRRLEPILNEGHAERLLQGLASSNPFVAGTCAAALAGIGFRSSSPDDTAWLDREVPHRLVRTVSGEDFSNDHSALQGVAIRRLALLTGQTIGGSGPRWIDWWTGAAPGFRSRRAVIPARTEDAGKLRVSVTASLGGAEAFELVGPELADASQPPPATGVERLYLSASQAADLFEVLRREDVFGGDRLPGARGGDVGAGRSIEVSIGAHVKGFRFAGALAEDWFERVAVAAFALRERNRWQRYPDPGRHPTQLDLWRSEASWWDSPANESEREMRMKESVLRWLRGCPAAERDPAVAELARLAREHGALEIGDFPRLLDLIAQERFLGPRARALVQIARICAGSGGPEVRPELLGRLTVAMASTFGGQAAPEIGQVLHEAGPEAARAAAAAEEPLLRAVAAAMLAKGLSEPNENGAPSDSDGAGGEGGAPSDRDGAEGEVAAERASEDLALLMRLLRDKDPEVEKAAVLALGENKIEAARTELLVRARIASAEVRAAALLAIGKLGGEGVFDALLTGLVQRDQPKVVEAAARGLAFLRDPSTAPLLISLIAKGGADPAGGPAREGLLVLGDAAWPDLLRVVHSPAHRARREAMLILSRQGVPQVASPMISLFTENPSDAALASELCVLTCTDLRGAPDPAAAWWSWWEGVVHDDSLAWRRAALERAGAKAPPPEALAGEGTREGALFLIEVMGRGEPHLVERARRELSRLLGAEVGPPPAPGAERTAWLGGLRKKVDERWK